MSLVRGIARAQRRLYRAPISEGLCFGRLATEDEDLQLPSSSVGCSSSLRWRKSGYSGSFSRTDSGHDQMRGFSQRAGCAPQQGLGIAGAALQRWRTDADANTWNIARALCSTTQPPTASKILGPRAARGDAPASSSRQSFSTSVRAAGRRDPPGGSDKDTESDSEAGVDPSEDEESDWSDMEDDDDEEEGEGEGEQVDPGHEIWMTRAEEIAQEAAMRSPSEARHLTTEAVALMTRPLVAAAQAAPDGAAETLWKPRKPIRTPAEVVRHLAETASAGAPVGPWLEHVIAAETTLPPAYEVQLRLSAFDRGTVDEAVALVQRICHLCDLPVKGPTYLRNRRMLMSVPKSPFKFKKSAMSQFVWGYHERAMAFPVRTERRLRFFLHCMRQARFPLTEVKMTLKYRTGVYASHQEGPWGDSAKTLATA